MKTMIMVAPNGARKTKVDHLRIPIGAVELAAEAEVCLAAGASAIHLHVRDDDEKHALDAERYLEVVAAVKAQVGDAMVIQITTEAVGIFSVDQQMDCVRAVKPQAVSIALNEIAPVGENTDKAQAFFLWLQTEKISPQFILYDGDQVQRFFELKEQGVIPFVEPFLLFVLGRYTTDQQSEPKDLDPFLKALGNQQAQWGMCAFGRREADCAVYAAENGGHVRIGFENNMLLPNGETAPSNAALIAATKAKLIDAGMQIMNGLEAQALLTDSLR